jgi:hypothetical protein
VIEPLARHLDVLEAQLELMRGQIVALRHALPDVARETPALVPASCVGIEKCGLKDEDQRMYGSGFGSARQWVCKGCGNTFGC